MTVPDIKHKAGSFCSNTSLLFFKQMRSCPPRRGAHSVVKREEVLLFVPTVALPPDAPFSLFHNGDFGLGRLCYMLVRVTRPSSVVETGVCYGVTSAFLLQAIRVNGNGCLHSIDFPPFGQSGDEFVGRLVPEQLRSYWRLHRGRKYGFASRSCTETINRFLLA